MIADSIVLKKTPRIEFRFLENGFQLIDEETAPNSGFYAYEDTESIKLNKPWFPLLAKCLRFFSWILNGVPLFPDAKTWKNAGIVFHLKQFRLNMFLTDSGMAAKARKLKKVLDKRLGRK